MDCVVQPRRRGVLAYHVLGSHFWFIRTCHHPIREGIDQKLKYKQKQYKMKVLEKSDKLCIFGPIGLVIF